MNPLERRQHQSEQAHIPHHVVTMSDLHPWLWFLEFPERLVGMRIGVSRENEPLQLFQRLQPLSEGLMVDRPINFGPERCTGAEAEVFQRYYRTIARSATARMVGVAQTRESAVSKRNDDDEKSGTRDSCPSCGRSVGGFS